jgi:hypothetical protein
MNASPNATTCTFCGCWYLKEADALHSCEGEIKVRDVEIARLRNALENIRDGLSSGGAAVVIARQALAPRSTSPLNTPEPK